MMSSAPTLMINPSISVAPTRDHQPASWYWPVATTDCAACDGAPNAPGGAGLV